VFDGGGVIAGTSAGCAILGEIAYDAATGSLSGLESLTDARHENLTLTRGFLGLAPGVLFDTHFAERARLPRLALMLGHARERSRAEGWPREVLGVGVDPRTAVCVWPDGTAEVLGEGGVSLLRLPQEAAVHLPAGKPPMVTGVELDHLTAGYRIDLRTGAILSRPDYVQPVPVRPAVGGGAGWDAGVVSMDPFRPRRAHETMKALTREIALGAAGVVVRPETCTVFMGKGERMRVDRGSVTSGVAIETDGLRYAGVGHEAGALGAFEGARLGVIAPGEAVRGHDGTD